MPRAFRRALELRFQLLQLVQRLRLDGGGLGQQARSKTQAGVGARPLSIGPRQPVAEMEQLAGGCHRVGRRYFTGAVYRQIAQVLDEPGFGEQRIADHLPEAGLVNQGAQVVLIRQVERRFIFVEPCHRQFQGAPGVKAGGSRIGVRHGSPLSRPPQAAWAIRFQGTGSGERSFGAHPMDESNWLSLIQFRQVFVDGFPDQLEIHFEIAV